MASAIEKLCGEKKQLPLGGAACFIRAKAKSALWRASVRAAVRSVAGARRWWVERKVSPGGAGVPSPQPTLSQTRTLRIVVSLIASLLHHVVVHDPRHGRGLAFRGAGAGAGRSGGARNGRAARLAR